ncbi:MAG: hypothetical protein PW786_15490 [Arachidicoccus sp.]|nr:hypothetical protein [Arachidicoccus sp.]
MKIYNILHGIFAVIIIGSFCSCRPTADVPAPSKASLDLSKYVAIGNSITSGFADAALYYAGQQVSYPNLLAQQFAKVGGSATFVQPLVPENSVGIGTSGNSKLVLGVVNGQLTPVPAAATGDLSIFTTSVASQGPFNNMGVPGAKAITTIFPGYGNPANGAGNYNPFFTRMATNPATASVLSDAAAQKPTFFSMFIGNNDVLAYALAGGASDSISSLSLFQYSIGIIIQTMMSTAKQGAVANIPDITSLPYFTTIPYTPLATGAIGADTITQLNTNLYGPLKQALTAFGAGDRINLLSATAANPVLIKDVSLTNLSAQLTIALTPALGAANAAAFGQVFGQARQTTADDYILLTTSSVIGTNVPNVPSPINVYGISYPLDDQYVLTKTEAGNIQTATTGFNSILKNAASTAGLAYVDVNAFLASAKTGIMYDGRSINATFVTGGAFSLDGIHLTPLGNALLSNQFIMAINKQYGSTIPLIDASNYNGVVFP